VIFLAAMPAAKPTKDVEEVEACLEEEESKQSTSTLSKMFDVLKKSRSVFNNLLLIILLILILFFEILGGETLNSSLREFVTLIAKRAEKTNGSYVVL
jgi:hypothetical protein